MAVIGVLAAEVIGVIFFFVAEDFKNESEFSEKESCPVKKTRKKRRTKAEMVEENPPKYSEETRQTRDDMFTLPEEATR